ncbi:hypothetical protein CkaCkLH20_02957 [Colletotrichum karsti]|uniref:Uncharacterized protein n=1 Tax=Colletotrichum karsti TaxID=1095194 RepID=A0A9P6IBF0_9PEZI|nr:uncharacterized protein CkaCkLH20_02957 [Colletotrichum karsti]KAF9879414.1 hypothetical protein CkaCkLH20_02957 [Colletotrichum karsti]
MAIPETNVNRQREVMVVSSDSGPPRLDLTMNKGRRGTFSSFGSADDRGFSPRTARSSNDLFAQVLSRIETTDSDSEWGVVRARARENNDRHGMGDLINFLRTTSPPPQFPEKSVFDDSEDTQEQEEEEEPERWRLFKKLRRPRTRARSESPARRPRTAGLPNSAVASKTASGASHIAISIPLEYCHVGPDSDWALAIFNATPPLPPAASRASEDSVNGQTRPYASDRTVTVLKTVSEQGSALTVDTMSTQSQRQGRKGSVSIWPKINPNPSSQPRTPYATPPGSVRGTTSVSKKKRGRLAGSPQQYAELPASPVIMPQSPDESFDTKPWEAGILSQSPSQQKSKTKSPRRPENITLPPRRSSIKIVRPQTEGARDGNQASIDGMIGGSARRQSVTFDGPPLSPGYSEVPSLSPSIATTELSEPIITRARSAKAYSTASVIFQDSESTTPRPSLTIRPGSSDTTQTTLVNESVASRNPSTRTATSRQSRRDRVKNIKHRDMEAQRAFKKTREEDGETTPRPQTSETVISSLRLPSRDGTFGSRDDIRGMQTKLSATNLANMAESQRKSPSHSSNGNSLKISDWQATQRVDTPGWETAQEELSPDWETAREDTPTPPWSKPSLLDETMAAADSAASKFDSSLARDSTISSVPPRRWGSLNRTSWASSVPLLDRIGSFVLSEADAAKVGELVSHDNSTEGQSRMTRADSATLSQTDSARLTSPPLSIVESEGNLPRSETETTAQFIAGSIAAFPKPGPAPRLSAIMPVAEVVPGSVDERWSASTLNSPVTAVTHIPSANTQAPTLPFPQLARPHTAGNTNPELLNAAYDTRRMSLRIRPAADEGEASETATVRPKSRLRDDDGVDFLSMSARELRAHYATLRSARVNDLAHEMLLNQERLEMRMHQQERNQMLFIERLERCMSDLRSLPGSPFSTSRPLDWPLDHDNELVYEEQRISRVRRPNRLGGSLHQQHHSESSRPSRRRLTGSQDDFVDFDGDFIDRHDQRRQRRPSTSHVTPSSSRRSGAAARPRRHGAPPVLPPLTTRRSGLDSLDPLIRELQFAARVSQETNRTERIRTPQPGDPGDYYYNMI